MLYHMVMLEPAGGTDEIMEAMLILESLKGHVDGLVDFRHGPNRDFERKSERYPYGFLCTFSDKAALDAYAGNPDHQRAGGLLVGACKGGADGIFVVDLEV